VVWPGEVSRDLDLGIVGEGTARKVSLRDPLVVGVDGVAVIFPPVAVRKFDMIDPS
jgi:hypothetical protein